MGSQSDGKHSPS